jgi:hypothetical protein
VRKRFRQNEACAHSGRHATSRQQCVTMGAFYYTFSVLKTFFILESFFRENFSRTELAEAKRFYCQKQPRTNASQGNPTISSNMFGNVQAPS